MKNLINFQRVKRFLTLVICFLIKSFLSTSQTLDFSTGTNLLPNQSITFTNLSTGLDPNTKYIWSFGDICLNSPPVIPDSSFINSSCTDSTIGISQTISHTYLSSKSRPYNVQLKAIEPGGQVYAFSKFIYINGITCSYLPGCDNLIQNSTFEYFDFCPTSAAYLGSTFAQAQTDAVSCWYNPCYTTPDYWVDNVCSPTNHWIPAGPTFCQNDHSVGASQPAYIALVTFQVATIGFPPINWREYAQQHLSSSLMNNTDYEISFWVSNADKYIYSSNIGALLSTTPPALASGYTSLLNGTPQVSAISSLGHYVQDRDNWVQIRGIYHANGTEQYITIGNFEDDSPTNGAGFPWSSCTGLVLPTNSLAYYLVDDVTISNFFTTGSTTNSCQGLNNGSINITTQGGVPPFSFQWSNGATTQNLTNLAPGTYIVSVTDNAGCTITDSYVITESTQPCLSITKTASVSTINVGGTVDYSITVCNYTNTPQTVTVTDAFVPSFHLVGTDPFSSPVTVAPPCSTFHVLGYYTTTGHHCNFVNMTDPLGTQNYFAYACIDVTPSNFTVTKTVSDPLTYAGYPVTYTFTVTNNNASACDYTILDQLPPNFYPLGNPLCPGLTLSYINGNLSISGTVNIPGGQSITCSFTGAFALINMAPGYQNCVTVTESCSGQTQTACADNVVVLMNCPLVIEASSSGDCTPNITTVDLCPKLHTNLSNVTGLNFTLYYPDWLTYIPPPTTSVFSSCTMTATTGGTPITIGSMTFLPLTVSVSGCSSAITLWYSQLMCFHFVLNAVPPNGINTGYAFVENPSGVRPYMHFNYGGGSQPTEQLCQIGVITLGCPLALSCLDPGFTFNNVACSNDVVFTPNTISCSGVDPNSIVHRWYFHDNSTTPMTGTGTNPYTHTFTGTGTFTVDHTVLDFITMQSATSSQQVTVYSACCTAQTTIPDGSSVSGLGFNAVSGTVDVQGTFYIDQPFDFTNATVTAEPAAEIIVMPTNNLNVDHTDISACSNMWKGITVQNDASLRVLFSNLADAQYAINLNDRSTAVITNNTFERNFVGIYTPQSPIDFNNINLFVAENTFKSGGGLVAAFTGQTPVPSQKSFAGMQLYDMALDLSNPGFQPNIFTDMSNGIVGSRLELDATNCLFTDIILDANYNSLLHFNGSGVYDRGGHGFFSVRQIGFGKTAAQSTFDNCHYGITGEDINLYSTDNKMTNMDMDYRIDYSSYMNIDILNNYLHSKMNGIDLRYNDNAEHILVQDNEMHFGDPTITMTKGHSAIQVIEQNGKNPNSVIHHNFIYYNANSTNARNGIFLNSASNYKVTENTLTMFDNSYNPNGIYSFGSVSPEISCNFVYGSYTNYTNKYQSAITVTMNDVPTVACNTVDGTYNGIYFSGASYGTDVKGNNINTHVCGVHLDNTAIIGNQDYKGNLWYQVAVGSGKNAIYDNLLNAMTYTWKVDPTITIPGSNPVPMSSIPSGWIIPLSGNNFQCSQNGNYCSQFLANGGGSNNFDHQIANGTLQNNPFTDETKWTLKGDLYKKLDDDQSLMTGDATLTNFYNQTQSLLIGQFKDINDVNETLFDLDPAVRNNLNVNKQLLQQQMAQLKTYTAQLLSGTLTSTQIASTQASITSLQLSISNLITYNKTALDLARNTRVLNADNTKSVNDGLNTSEIIEQNEKDIHSVYLATIAKGIYTFTANQALTILAVAQQCPMSGGRAVPIARGFYEMIDESMTYDDVATCLQGGIILRHASSGTGTPEDSVFSKKQISSIFKPYFIPNPAKQNATLFYQFENTKDGFLYLSNYLGQVVLKQALKANENSVLITTGSLANGIYHYKVISSGDEIGNGKLAVIK